MSYCRKDSVCTALGLRTNNCKTPVWKFQKCYLGFRFTYWKSISPYFKFLGMETNPGMGQSTVGASRVIQITLNRTIQHTLLSANERSRSKNLNKVSAADI